MVRQDKRELEARQLLLCLPDGPQDPKEAQRLIDEVRDIEGDSGLLWRFHQARSWLSGPGSCTRQADIIESLERCVDGDPAWAEPALLLAEMYQRLGWPDRAEAVCRQVLWQDPSATHVADYLMRLLEKLDRLTDARSVLMEVQTAPSFVSKWRLRIALRSGDIAASIAGLNLRLPQSGPAAYELLGRSYARVDRLDQAVAAFEAGLNAHPNSIPLRRGLMSALFLRKGTPDRGRSDKILSELEKLLPNDPVLLRIRASRPAERQKAQSADGQRGSVGRGPVGLLH
jgi:tetratricopeptide (TPR) repeat protein